MWICPEIFFMISRSKDLIKKPKKKYITQSLELPKISKPINEVVIINNEKFVTVPLED